MKESNLNTDISRSINNCDNCWIHKIADGIGGISIQNPFDHFGILNNTPLYSESKLLKGLKAFSFSLIEDHQKKNLEEIKALLHYNNVYTLYFLGVFVPYKFYYLFVFDVELIPYLISIGKKSILKKELEILIENGLYLQFEKRNKKYYINEDRIQNIEEIIIGVKRWKNIIG